MTKDVIKFTSTLLAARANARASPLKVQESKKNLFDKKRVSKRLILIFQKPSLSELAPSLKGGCRGFKGPVPQPLWIRTTYSVVERNYKAAGTFVKIFVPEDATRTRFAPAAKADISLMIRLISCFRRERRRLVRLLNFGAILLEQNAQHRSMAARLVLAVATHRKISMM